MVAIERMPIDEKLILFPLVGFRTQRTCAEDNSKWFDSLGSDALLTVFCFACRCHDLYLGTDTTKYVQYFQSFLFAEYAAVPGAAVRQDP